VNLAVDSSAIIAILSGEAEAEEFTRLLVSASRKLICAGNWLEVCLVAQGRWGNAAVPLLQEWLDQSGLRIVAFDQTLLPLAQEAGRTFGKGRHPAGLNFGDCMAYALAKRNALPLLCKGADFSLTDIRLAR
jgi:ribonuclease VapC